MNVGLHIDDFGTGYSSLSYLHRFPVDTLKIDRSFVTRMGAQDENHEIVRTIVILAHSLGMAVLAEGIETAAQLDQLRHLSCDLGQGSFFSPPLEADRAGAMIASKPRW
jgi:EAL domain-containing protein (putative c-di-GMP-specific phosphodiesterase class I)